MNKRDDRVALGKELYEALQQIKKAVEEKDSPFFEKSFKQAVKLGKAISFMNKLAMAKKLGVHEGTFRLWGKGHIPSEDSLTALYQLFEEFIGRTPYCPTEEIKALRLEKRIFEHLRPGESGILIAVRDPALAKSVADLLQGREGVRVHIHNPR